jgi:uncharacterized membrane protein SpoIIM required for sporulation/ABC-type transport system involved in multi-copper enzyme maturation permease subunit
MFAKIRPALIVTRREIIDQFRDWRIIFPVVLLTLLFPGLMNFTARQMIGFVQHYGAPTIGDRLIPFLLMVVGFFPISVSLVIALESFVGEKERRSIEPLLSSPLNDWQLYLGKLLAAIFPPLSASYIGIAVYLFGVHRQVGWSPDVTLLIMILVLTTVQALVMVSGAVVISSQTTSVRAANLLASFIIIPMTLLIQGESVVMFWANYNVLWWAVGGNLVIAGLLIRTGVAHFNREELLGQELDSLNLRWAWRTFWKAFFGQVHSPLAWYRQEVSGAFRRLRAPLALMSLGLVVGMLIGGDLSRRFVLPSAAFNLDNLNKGFVEGMETLRLFTVGSVPIIWLHNLRVMLLASLLGIFSFGVLAVVVLLAPLVLIGYFTGSAAAAGLSPWIFLTAFVLPHGVLEVPALLIGGAAILRLGATLAAPAHGKTIGEAWLQALADWAKIMLALVIPLLLGAAALEVLVTPRVVGIIFGG